LLSAVSNCTYPPQKQLPPFRTLRWAGNMGAEIF
jgi:hypothetical protein